MRPPEFSEEDIIQAGEKLQQQYPDRKVTAYQIRKALGDRGNPQRYKAVWEEYLAKQPVLEQHQVAELPVEVAQQLEDMNERLTQTVRNMVIHINDQAVRTAESRVREVVRLASEQRQQAELETVEASEVIEDLEGKLEARDEELENLKTVLAASQEGHQASKVAHAQLQERLTALEQSSKEAAQLAREREEDLKSQLKEAASKLEQAREREAMAVGARDAADRRHDEDVETMAQLRVTIRDLEGTVKAAEMGQARVEQELKDHKARTAQEVQRMAKQLQTKDSEALAARQAERSAQEIIANLQGQVDVLGRATRDKQKPT